MSMLEAALAWAARGFRVFPIRAGTKDQPLFEGWQHHATTDAAQIRQWWTDPFGMVVVEHNVGVCTTGMVVVDADPKKGGLVSAFETLGLGLDTLIVRTPSGGLHFYYNGPDSALSVGRIALGIDIRSHNGYVLAPGSKRSDGVYSLEIDAPLAQVPAVIAAGLRAPQERQETQAQGIEMDRPDAIELATLMLRRAEPAIEGMGGDQRTYEVACQVRDLAVSDDTALALMLEEWNPRCSPPWDADELWMKVQNAYDYATGAAGSKHPAMTLDGIEVPAIETVPLPVTSGFGNARSQLHIPARDWRMQNMLLRKLVTLVTAPGAANKSTLALTIAAHKALGKDFAGFKTHKGKTVIYNAEDDLDEQSRRLNAICIRFGFDFDEVRSQLYLLDREAINLKLTVNDPPLLNGEHVRFLIEACSDPECDLLILDPFVSLLSSSEDDNAGMDYVMDVIKIVAREANVAVMAVDHSRKGNSSSQAGDISSNRGASAKGMAARIGLTMTTASERDCEEWSIPANDRHAYVRLDGAKMNLSPSGAVVWFKRSGVKLYSGDEVGVIEPVDLSANDVFLRRQMAETFLAEMTGRGVGSLGITEAVALLQRVDPLYGALSVAIVKNRIVKQLALGVDVNGNMVAILHETAGGRSSVKVVLR